MKVYFKEITTRDYSRVGYENISISCSAFPYGTEEGYDASSVWYFVEISDSYTQDEAMKLANEAISKALAEEISVRDALFSLTNEKRRRKKS